MPPKTLITKRFRTTLARVRITPDKVYLRFVRIFDSYKPGGHHFNKALLWEYDTEKLDLQKCRRLVATRVLEMGRLETSSPAPSAPDNTPSVDFDDWGPTLF